MAKKSEKKGNKKQPQASAPKLEQLVLVEPMTKSQGHVFDAFKKGNHICMSGSAGTGKTFIAMYLGLEEVLSGVSPRDKVILVRSVVPTRDIGFLPGSKEEKEATYLTPYVDICRELTGDGMAWNKMNARGTVQFLTTSFVRGITLRKAVVIIDEAQNLTFHELCSIITRLGEDCRFIMCGDYYQSDLEKKNDKNGVLQFMNILDKMKYFSHVEFGWEDIVRGPLVRDFIVTKEMIEQGIYTDEEDTTSKKKR